MYRPLSRLSRRRLNNQWRSATAADTFQAVRNDDTASLGCLNSETSTSLFVGLSSAPWLCLKNKLSAFMKCTLKNKPNILTLIALISVTFQFSREKNQSLINGIFK